MNAGDRRARRPARRRRALGVRAVASVVGAVVVFGLGIALGQAIEENGGKGGNVTYQRTIDVRPAPVTVTVTATSR